MNKRSSVVLLFSLLLSSIPTALHAQAERVYFRFDAGPAWTEKTDFEEFATENVNGAELKFETGVRFSFAGGYQITDWFSAELEGGFIYNEADLRGINSDGDLDVSRAPILANVVLQCPRTQPFVPFIGAGLGGAASVLAVDDLTIGTTTADGTFSDFVFAWQGFAGVRYAINETMSLGAIYKYFYSAGPEWDPDLTIGTTGDIRADSMETHSISFVFNLRF